MPEQASLFLTHPGHDGAPPRIVPNVPPRKPGLSEPEAAKRRKHNTDVERHRAEAARVLASPVRRHVLNFVGLHDGQAFRLSSLYAYVDERHPCGLDTPRRVLGFLADDGLLTLENVDRGVYRARLTGAGRAAVEDDGGEG